MAARLDKAPVAAAQPYNKYSFNFQTKECSPKNGIMNRYRKVPLPTDYSVDWISYDWALNATTKDQ